MSPSKSLSRVKFKKGKGEFWLSAVTKILWAKRVLSVVTGLVGNTESIPDYNFEFQIHGLVPIDYESGFFLSSMIQCRLYLYIKEVRGKSNHS